MITNKQIKEEVTEFMEKTLDFVQVACPPTQWKPVRSKILRHGNNCIRNLISKREKEEIYNEIEG